MVGLIFRQACYPAIANLVVSGRDWSTEIDHVVRTPGSIVVIETKILAGRIEGWSTDKHWVQRIGGRERWFLNPLRQNASHLEVLRRAIGPVDMPLRGLVVVAGSATIGDELRGSVVFVGDLGQVLQDQKRTCSPALDQA